MKSAVILWILCLSTAVSSDDDMHNNWVLGATQENYWERFSSRLQQLGAEGLRVELERGLADATHDWDRVRYRVALMRCDHAEVMDMIRHRYDEWERLDLKDGPWRDVSRGDNRLLFDSFLRAGLQPTSLKVSGHRSMVEWPETFGSEDHWRAFFAYALEAALYGPTIDRRDSAQEVVSLRFVFKHPDEIECIALFLAARAAGV